MVAVAEHFRVIGKGMYVEVDVDIAIDEKLGFQLNHRQKYVQDFPCQIFGLEMIFFETNIHLDEHSTGLIYV